MKTKLAFLTPCLAFALGTSPISAAPISWTVHDITNDVTNVSTAGTLVVARTGSATANQTVNGVTFLSAADSGNLFDSLFANDFAGTARFSGTTVTEATYATFLKHGQRSGRLGFGVLPRIEPTEVWTTVNFTGLTIGNSYQIQIWASDTDLTLANAGNKGLLLGNGSANVDPVLATDTMLLYEVADGPDTSTYGSGGQYGIGTFTADATTQSFNVRTYSNLLTTPAPTSSDHFSNGWQLRDQGVDTSPPNPDPMTWFSDPAPVNDSTITMTATTATDQTGVEYQFTRYAADGTTLLFTSPWQDSPEYTDTGLSDNTTYNYTVTARDKTPSQFTTAPSTPVAPATTPALDVTPPSPSPLTWFSVPNALDYSTITMTADTATDDNGVEYQFKRYAADGTTLLFTSPWQDSPEFTDTGLSPNTTYNYTVQAQDKSAGQNQGLASSTEPATTDSKGAATITWNAFNITDDVTNVSTTGTLLDARSGSTNDQTVNGVTFESVANSGNLFDSFFKNDIIGARGYGSVVTNVDYRNLLATGQRSGLVGSEVWTTVEFFGLTPGNTYQIQIWASDVSLAASLDGIVQNTALVLGDGSASGPNELTDTFIYTEMTDGGAGQYGIGTFVADATNQAFNVRQRNNLTTTPAWSVGGHFSNGWQIRDVTGVSSNPFDTWAGTGTLPGTVTFEGDLNGDGVQDGLAFLLGAANPDDSALGLLPTTSETGGGLVMSFTCLATADRGTAALNLEYDGDLAGTWLSVPVPGAAGANPIVETTATGSVSFVATDGVTNSNGDALIDIVATISDATESASGKLFGRLKGTE